MSSNKNVRLELEKIYGKKDMFLEAKIEEQIDELNKTRKKKIRTYREFKEKTRFKKSKTKQLEKQMSYHHGVHKSDGGKATVENGFNISSLTHMYLHSLPRDEEEIINNMLRNYKKDFKMNIAEVTTQEVTPIAQLNFDEPQEFIEIEAEDMTLEEWIEYKKHKEERNLRTNKKFNKWKESQKVEIKEERKYLTPEKREEQRKIYEDVLMEMRY